MSYKQAYKREKETSGSSKVTRNLFEYRGNRDFAGNRIERTAARLSRKCFNEFLPWRTREVAHSVVSQFLFFLLFFLFFFSFPLCPIFSARLRRGSLSVAIIFFAGYHRGQLFQRSVRKLFPANRDSEENSLGFRDVSNVLESAERELNMGKSNACKRRSDFRG